MPFSRLRNSLIMILFLLVGCQPTVYLMPTPLAIGEGDADPFQFSTVQEFTNTVDVFYATNRQATGPKSARNYIKDFDQTLRLGQSLSRIGDENLDWDTLYTDSLANKRQHKYKMHLVQVLEAGEVGPTERLDTLPPGAKLFIEGINKALSKTLDKNLLIYAHGANNNFYRASSQAAQYRHFTGRNTVVVLFAWPTAENLIKYQIDKKNAAETAGVFARLVELLGRYSEAKNINIIGYSAGAAVVSPGLSQLRQRFPETNELKLKEKLRVGQVYLAQPDVRLKNFIEQIPHYIGIVKNVTTTVNLLDSTLYLAETEIEGSRLGMPDAEELTPEQVKWARAQSFTDNFDIISMTHSKIPGSAGAHDFWYNNPWVSSDVIMQLVHQAPPERRGLMRTEGDQASAEIWFYPKDYPQRLAEAIKVLRHEHPANEQLEMQ